MSWTNNYPPASISPLAKTLTFFGEPPSRSLPDFTNENTGYSVISEYQIQSLFSITMSHAVFGMYFYKTGIYLKFLFNRVSCTLSGNPIPPPGLTFPPTIGWMHVPGLTRKTPHIPGHKAGHTAHLGRREATPRHLLSAADTSDM